MYYTCISIIHSIQQPTTLSAQIGFFLIHFPFHLSASSQSLVFYQISNRAFVLFGFFPLLLSVTPINRDPATPSYPLGKRDPARKPPHFQHFQTLNQPTCLLPSRIIFSFNRYLTTANLPPHLVDPLLFLCLCHLICVFLGYSNH